jgi:hypothetical protein
MIKWSSRLMLVVIAFQPLLATAILMLMHEAVTQGTVLASMACSFIQLILLLLIQRGAEKTDDIARATHKELKDASEIDYVAIFNEARK